MLNLEEKKIFANELGWGFSLDVETGGTDKQKSPVLTIGVVHGNFFTGEITDEFYARVDPKSMPKRDWDQSTIEWWLKVNDLHPTSYREVSDESLVRLPIDQVLKHLKNWISKVKRTKYAQVFGKGPEFDNEFIDVLCQENGINLPWRFRCNQSHRTTEWLLASLTGEYPHIPYDQVTHHALEDARAEFQATVRDLRMVIKEELLPDLAPRNLNVKLFEPSGDILPTAVENK